MTNLKPLKVWKTEDLILPQDRLPLNVDKRSPEYRETFKRHFKECQAKINVSMSDYVHANKDHGLTESSFKRWLRNQVKDIEKIKQNLQKDPDEIVIKGKSPFKAKRIH